MESIQCPICYDIFMDPRILTCGHTFCNKCIKRLDKTVCPMCKKSFNSGEQIKNYILCNTIEEFKKLNIWSDNTNILVNIFDVSTNVSTDVSTNDHTNNSSDVSQDAFPDNLPDIPSDFLPDVHSNTSSNTFSNTSSNIPSTTLPLISRISIPTTPIIPLTSIMHTSPIRSHSEVHTNQQITSTVSSSIASMLLLIHSPQPPISQPHNICSFDVSISNPDMVFTESNTVVTHHSHSSWKHELFPRTAFVKRTSGRVTPFKMKLKIINPESRYCNMIFGVADEIIIRPTGWDYTSESLTYEVKRAHMYGVSVNQI